MPGAQPGGQGSAFAWRVTDYGGLRYETGLSAGALLEPTVCCGRGARTAWAPATGKGSGAAARLRVSGKHGERRELSWCGACLSPPGYSPIGWRKSSASYHYTLAIAGRTSARRYIEPPPKSLPAARKPRPHAEVSNYRRRSSGIPPRFLNTSDWVPGAFRYGEASKSAESDRSPGFGVGTALNNFLFFWRGIWCDGWVVSSIPRKQAPEGYRSVAIKGSSGQDDRR